MEQNRNLFEGFVGFYEIFKKFPRLLTSLLEGVVDSYETSKRFRICSKKSFASYLFFQCGVSLLGAIDRITVVIRDSVPNNDKVKCLS